MRWMPAVLWLLLTVGCVAGWALLTLGLPPP